MNRTRLLKRRTTVRVWGIVTIAATLTIAACGGGSEPGAISGLQDGTYFGTSEFTDANGWAPFLQIQVEGGRIADALFDYANPVGALKSQDAPYNQRMKAASGSSPEEFSPALAGALVDNQRLPVETITGATSSSRWFNQLAEAVVERARAGDRRVTLLPMSATYRAEDESDERGWIGTIAVTYERQTITDVRYDEVQREGNTVTDRKSENEGYIAAWKAANGVDLDEVLHRLAEQLMAEGRPAGVDLISGATSMSRRFRVLARQAIDGRIPVDFQTIQQAIR